MVEYTALEQVLQDPSLAVINENITSLRELNKVYAKY